MDAELMRHALTVARSRGFAEVEIAEGEGSFSARLDPKPGDSSGRLKSSAGSSLPDNESSEATAEIRSTLVGYYREARTPLRVGANVNKGDNVAVIVALGIANDIESKVSGEVVEVLVEPEQPVEYGQVLAKVNLI